MARITVLYFAHLTERTGTREEQLDLPADATAGSVRKFVESLHPKLGGTLATCRVAVDEEFASDETVVHDGQTVAFIPPVSGG
ncbi:MAG: molybdopterin converting factor subunit 1 [Planctomycetes bacterium]|nr:molybdopterin converting factor subunit 1 [Planctomycetota bacterium]